MNMNHRDIHVETSVYRDILFTFDVNKKCDVTEGAGKLGKKTSPRGELMAPAREY
jgi:hypothetical protein